jgi:hypothetical protein
MPTAATPPRTNGGSTLSRLPSLGGGASFGLGATSGISTGGAPPSSGATSSAPSGGQGDSDSDGIYRELLHRLRAEQEQLGQVIDEPF